MASLKFIMDVDDDQPDQPPRVEGGEVLTRTTGRSQGFGQPAPGLAYPDFVSSSDQVTGQTAVGGSRRGAASNKLPSGVPTLTATSTRSSNRRRSSASNDSVDQAGYGSGASSSSRGTGLNPSSASSRPMPGPANSDMPVKYTPITGRVSRARKGVPVHTCEICRPPKTFTRAEHLRRHQLSHEVPGYRCTYAGCDRAFHRPDLLARHESRHTELEGDDTSAVRGGGADDGQSLLAARASLLDLAGHAESSPGLPGGQATMSNPSARSSEAPSTPSFSTHAPSLQPTTHHGGALRQAPSPDPMIRGDRVYDFTSSAHPDSLYSSTSAFSVVVPAPGMRATSIAGTSYPTELDPFQQPRSTPSVFETQGLSLPSLSIPESNPPELCHPDVLSPWASSTSDSTYSTPVSDNARNPRYWLGQHPPTQLLTPYPNPASRNPSRASLDSITAAAPPSIFADAFQEPHFSQTTGHNPNYDIMVDVPMSGFDAAEHSDHVIPTPTSQMTNRPHHRHSTSSSSMRTTGPSTSGLMTTSMHAIPDRTAVFNNLNRHKDHLVNISDPHENSLIGGVDFNMLEELGSGFDGMSHSGTGSASGLLAALDLPMTGCGPMGVTMSYQHLPPHVLAAVPGYIEVYWEKFHTLYPIIHRASFNRTAGYVLRYAMAAVATQYLDTREDRLRGNQLHEHTWHELKRIPEWSLETMQAILLCEIFARFRGRKAVTRPSKMFESLYLRVLYHNPTLFDAALPATDDAFQPADRWHAWVEAESRRRLLTACFVTDVHASAFQQQRRAHECDFTSQSVSPTIPLSASSRNLWEASSATCWAYHLATDPESGVPTFAQTSDALRAEEIESLPWFDRSAVLALELVHLPRLLAPTMPLLPDRRSMEDENLDPLIVRPKSTPGYSTTSASSPINPTLETLVFPLSCALPHDTNHAPPLHPQSRICSGKTTTEERISLLFPTSPRTATYLALHHTPLHDLLAVSGDTWIFSQKVLSGRRFVEHQRRLRGWVEAAGVGGWVPEGQRGGEEKGRGLSVALATGYAARALVGFLKRGRERGDDEEEEGEEPAGASAGADGGKGDGDEPGAGWMVDLSDYWGLYVCALIFWAVGYRTGAEGRRRGKGMDDGEVMEWLRMVSEMEPDEVVKLTGRREAAGVVGLVRRRLEWDCVGGRSRLYVDAVGVLKKLEEGGERKWF